MEVRIVDFITIVAALVSIGAISGSGIRYMRQRQRDPRVIGGVATAVLAVVVGAILFAKLVPVEVSYAGKSTLKLPVVAGIGAVSTPTATITPRPTSAPLPTATPVYALLPTATSGVYNESVQLTCGGCDEPVLTTLTQIAVDTTNQNTTWAFHLHNHSGATCPGVYIDSVSLTAPDGQTYAGAGPETTSSAQVVLNPGDTADKHVIFALVPRAGATYNLTAYVNCKYVAPFNGGSGTTYGPQPVSL